jgi:hypothetical protein
MGGRLEMLLAPLAGAVLVMSIATGPVEPRGSMTQMTVQQKNAAMQPLVRSATECIARAVAGDARFGILLPTNLGDLITDSIPGCMRPVRAMIDGYDRYFGEGTGEAFFMGPYLDVLPTMVSRWTEDVSR